VDAILIKSRYKVTQVLYACEDYAALLAVDLESRDKTEYLLNVYDGTHGRRYVGIFEQLRHCREYMEKFVSDGALTVVFTFKPATGIDDVFYKGAVNDWLTRVHYAQLLFHLALSVSDFPPEIACAAFLSRNLKVLPSDKQLAVNYVIPPMDDLNAREVIFLLSDQVRKVLTRRFCMSVLERKFLESLEANAFTSIIALYSEWQEVMKTITVEYERVYKMWLPRRLLHFAISRLRRKKRR